MAALIPALSDGPRGSRTRRLTGPGCSPPCGTCSARSARERRTALVVEDLHWADSGTLDLLTFLVRALPPGTALIATSRRDELPA